ncbi:hypothetical protein QYE76_066531 [Lolium multiflorum]|uniref:Gag-pol polyprotein n=1 Tax=Lolium multiflorum TaxID=4521 RepID=A0AAD8SAN9_LOLMU|nr:hypothetical protein QYE76_066531 [Lolium multiflorum]
MQLKKVQDDACKAVDKVQRWSLFQTQCIIKGKACKLMIDGGSCTNGISKAMVAALGLSTWRLPEPKRLEWLNSCGMLKITHKARVPFTVGDYIDEIECDVLPLEVCGLLLGRPWQYDRNVTHAGRANTYSFMHGGKQRTLKPMGDDHIKSDVELVVRKEKLHKPKVQQEVHVVPSIDVGDVSAMPVDDKPVLVGDKPDEATLLVDEDVAACATVPVCVDASIQTDDVCADDVSVHVAQMRVGGVGGERVSGDSGQRHYRARSTAVQFTATPRMHRGKDGRVRHQCGPGITHLVQGHVQRHKGPSKPHKKKELAPKYETKGGAKCCIKSSRPRGRTWCGRQARLEDGEDVSCSYHIMASPSINFNQFLEKEKLKSNGSNFTDWFRHVRIFLNGGNLQYVLDAPLGSTPPPVVSEEEKNVFEARAKVYSQVQCAILCSLEAELQKRFEHHDPCDMMRELKVIFETHAAVESYEASKQFFGCMMEEGSSVSEHMFAMSGHAKLSDLGIVIPNQLGIHRVLQSLPPSYKNFVMNYNMQNMNKELPELFSMLKSAEVEIQKEHQVLMVNKTTKFKKQGKPKKDLKKGGKKVVAHPEKPKGGPKPDTDCYYCNGKGHWKRNCSKYLADLKSGLVKKKKGISDIHVIDVYLTGSRTSAWVFDTGSVAHICNSKQELRNKRSLARDEVTMRVGNGSKVDVIAVGTLPLHLPSGLVLDLNNCYLVPALSMNIISGSCLMQDGYSFKSENNGCSIFMNNIFYGHAPEKNGLFLLNLDSSDTHVHNIDAKRIKLNDNSTYMWHCRLGHIGVKRMKKLHADGLLESLDFQSLDRCEACLMGKMTKTPFSGIMERATDLLEIIHTDVCGPMSVASRGGYRYVLTFTDDLSRYGYIYFMKHKSETFEKFKEFQSEVENQRNKKIKFLRSDRGGEYLSYEFGMHLKKCGILSQLTPPGTPQRNGVSERRNRTLLDMVRSMMSLTDLPLSFWGYALETAAFTLNRAPSKSVATTPYELWFNKKPKLSFLKVWGCEAYVKKLQSDKLEPKAEKCVFIGYPKETIGYTFYHRSEGKIFVAKNGTFLEKEFLTKERSTEDVPVPPAPVTEEANDNDHETSSEVATEPRRSTRERTTPDWYDPCLNLMIVDNNDEDPATYEEAMMSPDSNKWQEAMKSEMGSMYDNKVWTLVDLPDSRKAVENKWIFKRKTDADGNVTVYKARLVAKGFRQIQGVDYDETFSPVAKLKSVRILLAIAAFFDYEIWQMDVKTAFLNGDIEEELYMCTVAKSSTESEYIAASEASSEAVWMKRFIVELGVVPSALDPLVIYCDNMGAIANAQEPRSNVDPNNVPLASLVAQEENVDLNFIKNNNFNNNAYRNNSGNNYRPYPSANGNGYGNSYGNSYNNNRSVPSGLEAMLKEFISTQTAFNKSVEEKLDKIDILASRVDRLASDVNLLKLKVMPNNDIDNKITTTANAIQVRINENIRLMAELRARWDREENEKLAKENNVAKVWTITTKSNVDSSHVAAPPTINGKIIGVGNVSTPSAKRTKLPEIAKTAETACDKTAEIFSNLEDNDPIAVAHNDLDFDDCHISEVIKFLQKLAKSPNASVINLAFTKHITNALIKAREEKLKLETSIPRKLEDGWEPIIKMKFNDFECNALCDLGASISVMPKKIYDMLDLPPLKNCYLDVNLADNVKKKPLGMIDNVRITVNNNLVPVDFVVLDIECNASCPIVLGRPFLRTVGAVIDMREGNIKYQFPLKKGMEHFPRKRMKLPFDSIIRTSYDVDASTLDVT